jgi:hypothetical protein
MPAVRFVHVSLTAFALAALAAPVRAQDVVIRPREGGAVEVLIPTAADGSRVLPWNIEQVQAMKADQTLDIRGVIGAVRVHRSKFRDLASFTVSKADGGPTPRVVVLPHLTGVTVCAVYPSPNPTKPNTCLPDGKAKLTEGIAKNWPEVTFDVGLPDGVNVAVHVITGDIRADAPPQRDVTLVTGKGRIAVVDYGAATLHIDSTAGDMQLTVAALPSSAPRSVFGSVRYGTMTVRLHDTTPVRLYVSGTVRSVFPLAPGVAGQQEATLGPETGPVVAMRLSAGPLGTIDIQSADEGR